ncbi:class IV lanthionine synthetase LanL [Solwaraspora sp. WMMD1047]|uniref:class IV lanthionine synthetase LanL n=1 Tax=Solwaraspora sp. WMMD1047 TaxID=3016102 RepID=UPI0024164AA0|nr:class IV lanthionine synthetase LanL [Solwaraspora sp. WMMD1047]MDG4830044.1 class IV lanthionine synthetase LanL [Solwaraspora sp. WMMD1047]
MHAEATTSNDEALLIDLVRPIVARYGGDDWTVTPTAFWCHVEPDGRRHRVQGWKLHLSATPLSAPLVLSRAATVLARHRVPFKFAGTLHRAAELVSRHFERSGGGKFITAYPDGGDDEIRALAEELHRVTAGLPGPGILSDRPLRPGSLVHYRFGAFRGVPALGNDGVYEVMLTAPDGTAATDQRRPWFTPPPWAPTDPFTGRPARPPSYGTPTAARPVLLNDRYEVREVIRHAYTGGVYRAIDRRTGTTVIVKQGRPHAGADITGRDVRDARRHEARMLQRFDGDARVPRLVELFTQQQDVFLVQEAVPGTTLRRWVADRTVPADADRWGPDPATAVRVAGDLVGLVEMVHGEGLVLRDLNPNNVMITDDGELRLIDLEALAGSGDPVVRTYTPGYGAPELTRGAFVGPPPEPAADLFSLGATLFHLVSGADPVLPPDEPPARPDLDRLDAWLATMGTGNAAARHLAPVILALLADDPAARPGPERLRAVLRAVARPAPATTRTGAATEAATPTLAAAGAADARWDRMISDSIGFLAAQRQVGAADRRWPAHPRDPHTDPYNVQHGAAGVLGALTRAAGAGADPAARELVAETAGWLRARVAREPRILPGLYLGRAGTAWAMLDAAGVLGDPQLAADAADLARRLPLSWPNPDVYHGLAGAGLTHLRCWEATADPDFLRRAAATGDALVAAAERHGGQVRWPVPPDFASALAGTRGLGFAHGVAGVGTFLLALGRATDSRAYLDLASAAAGTLAATALDDRGAAYWPSGERPGPMTAHLCNGSSGIGTFLAGAWRHRPDERLGALVAATARAVRRMRFCAAPGQCHGLAGDGEFLLDLAGLPGLAHCRGWAAELAGSVHARQALRAGRFVSADESGDTFRADFAAGVGGVLAFLVRLRHGGTRSWLPRSFTDLFEPAAPAEPAAAPALMASARS